MMLAWLLRARFLIGSVLLTSTFVARFPSPVKHQRRCLMAKLSEEKPTSYTNYKNSSLSSRPSRMQFVSFDDTEEEYEDFNESQAQTVTFVHDKSSSLVNLESYDDEGSDEESDLEDLSIIALAENPRSINKAKSYDRKPIKEREKVSDKEYEAYWNRLQGKRKRRATKEQMLKAYYSLDKNQTLAQKANAKSSRSKEWDYQLEPTSNADLFKVIAAALTLSAIFSFISNTLG